MDATGFCLKLLILATGALLAMLGNYPVKALLRRIEAPNKSAATRGTLFEVQSELPGGRWIGILERIGTYFCIVFGFPAGIAMILAVKGLGRYPELKSGDNPRIGELFIIGTFASLLWAAMGAGIAMLSLGFLF